MFGISFLLTQQGIAALYQVNMWYQLIFNNQGGKHSGAIAGCMASGIGISGFLFTILYKRVLDGNLYWYFILSAIIPGLCILVVLFWVGRTAKEI